jgi:hypothetical protein
MCDGDNQYTLTLRNISDREGEALYDKAPHLSSGAHSRPDRPHSRMFADYVERAGNLAQEN